ncbi:MAG: type VI secretion system Vgr family protein, partial [Thermodesulfobacteriota bacterium]
MDYLTKQKYSFLSRAPGVTGDSFGVVRFSGFEAISKPYEFEITVVSDFPGIDPLHVLQNPAVFTIHRDEAEDVHFNGILIEFQETQEFNGYFFFKAVLAPKLWWLGLTHHNQVFLDAAVPEIMESALKDAGLYPGIDFEFRLQKNYAPFEYICQYDESHFNFISRWAEREGIYYFFEQTANGEKVVFTDTKISHTDLFHEKDLKYSPPSGLDTLRGKEVIHSFICRHTLLPRRIYLKDYNYMKPSMAMEATADVDENGRGENYIYGLNFDTPEDGKRLANIRAEELIAGKSLFNGESSVPFIVPGYTFNLEEHYKSSCNRKYLITEVTHEGHQTGYLTAGLSDAVSGADEEMFYANTFTAIYSDAQFRPPQKAVKPKISGTINAKIDAASSGEYAELDDQGRYKVILPFDRSGRFGGKASAWFRMMQPYAGQNQGMHFPLHKGTEVMLTFLDGDPDRPIIAGAVPNPETASP